MADNYNQASKKSIYENNVGKMDNIGADLQDFLTSETFTVIDGCLGDFIERVHANINSTPQMVTTGAINQLDIQGEGNAVNLYGNPWLIYQDRGVNGSELKLYDTPHSYTSKMPPVEVFKDWILAKNITLRDNEGYRGKPSPFKHLDTDKLVNRAAWGMAKKVFKEGFKPRDVFAKEIPKLVEDLQEHIANMSLQAIKQVFEVKTSAQRIIIKDQ